MVSSGLLTPQNYVNVPAIIYFRSGSRYTSITIELYEYRAFFPPRASLHTTIRNGPKSAPQTCTSQLKRAKNSWPRNIALHAGMDDRQSTTLSNFHDVIQFNYPQREKKERIHSIWGCSIISNCAHFNFRSIHNQAHGEAYSYTSMWIVNLGSRLARANFKVVRCSGRRRLLGSSPRVDTRKDFSNFSASRIEVSDTRIAIPLKKNCSRRMAVNVYIQWM